MAKVPTTLMYVLRLLATLITGLFMQIQVAGADPAAEQKLYKRFEGVIRIEFEGDLSKAKAAVNAKGQTWTEEHDQILRTLMYNKAVLYAVCGVRTMDRAAYERGDSKVDPDLLRECMSTEGGEINKFLRLISLRTLVNSPQFVRCGVRARELDDERRFPSYDFLTVRHPDFGLYDWKQLNICIVHSIKPW